MTSSLNNFLLHYSYFAIFILSFISSTGIPAGSEVAIIGGGALASGEVHKLLSNGQPSSEFFHLSLVLVILLALAGEVLGSMVGYLIGLKGGRAAVDKWGKYLLLTHKDLDRAEAWFARRGEPVVLFGRFIPLLRSFVSFAAGLGEMAIAKFILFTVVGCAVWCAVLTTVGYGLGSSYHRVLKDFSYAGYVAAVLVVVAVAVLFVHRLRVVRLERAEQVG